MRPFLIVNPLSGGGGLAELRDAAAARAIPVHILQEGDDAAEIARGADADALAMAGGDGSLASVAAVAIERDLPFACVPFGTRNHFARDVGLDRRDPAAALEALADGDERRIDVGRANDRLFLNNVSLGVYARLVHRREHHRRRRNAFARLRALGIAAAHRHSLGITVDGEPVTARVVLVANNAYALDVFSLGERARLDEGRLHLYAPHFDSLRGVLEATWDERQADRFTVGARQGSLHAAFDGEPGRLETPIEFRIDPGALRLLVPPGPLA
jgi:diacylglycerol kinase family enzyme